MADLSRTTPLVIALVALVTPAGADEIGAQRASQLERLVRHDCGSCHGMTLKGGLGPDIRPQRFENVPRDAVAQIILDGVPGTAMPPWRPLISEADAHWIANYLAKGAMP